MIKSPEWKAMAIAVTIACVSMSLLALDAALDLNASGLTQRLQSAQASFMDTMGQSQLAFAIPTWARSKAPAEPQCQRGADRQLLTTDCLETTGALPDPQSGKHLVDF
jgi:hypothetical protein